MALWVFKPSFPRSWPDTLTTIHTALNVFVNMKDVFMMPLLNTQETMCQKDTLPPYCLQFGIQDMVCNNLLFFGWEDSESF